MKQQNHYIIGDVHGEYKTLLALVAKLPKDAKLIFVGDLIDRGLQSKDVVKFIRKNNHQVVMGNHESSLIKFGKSVITYCKGDISYEELELDPRWKNSGRIKTYASYGIAKRIKKSTYKFVKNNERVNQLQKDIEWMKKLPLYLELDAKHPSGKKVVVSHSNISQVWNIRHDKEQKTLFQRTTLWTREKETYSKADIFNIYGHTPKEYAVEIAEDYACIDRGCCFYGEKGYGKLSAYCVESGEVIEVAHV